MDNICQETERPCYNLQESDYYRIPQVTRLSIWYLSPRQSLQQAVSPRFSYRASCSTGILPNPFRMQYPHFYLLTRPSHHSCGGGLCTRHFRPQIQPATLMYEIENLKNQNEPSKPALSHFPREKLIFSLSRVSTNGRISLPLDYCFPSKPPTAGTPLSLWVLQSCPVSALT